MDAEIAARLRTWAAKKSTPPDGVVRRLKTWGENPRRASLADLALVLTMDELLDIMEYQREHVRAQGWSDEVARAVAKRAPSSRGKST